MGSIAANFSGTNGSRYYGNLVFNEVSVDTANNRSYVELYLYIVSNNSAYTFWGFNNEGRIYIDGGLYSYGNYTGYVTTTPQLICSWGGWLGHDSSGNLTITVEYTIDSGYCGHSQTSYGWTLTHINRYASITNFWQTGITDVGFTTNVSTDVVCDNLAVSLDGAGWVYYGGDYTTKSVYLGGDLTSGYDHTVKVSVRRKDSGLWTESGTATITTQPQNNFMAFLL